MSDANHWFQQFEQMKMAYNEELELRKKAEVERDEFKNFYEEAQARLDGLLDMIAGTRLE